MAELNKKLYIKNKDGTIETIKLYTTIDEVKKEQAYRPIMVGSMQAYYPLGDITNKYATKKRVKIGDTIYAALSETSVKEIKLSELPQTYVVDTGKYSLTENEKVFNISPQQLESLVIDNYNDWITREIFLYLDPDKGYDYNNIDFCKIPKTSYAIIYYGTAYPNINKDKLSVDTLDLSNLNDIDPREDYNFYYLFPHNKLIYNPRSDTKTKIGVVLDYNHQQNLKLPVNVMPANINNDITITGNNFTYSNLLNILSDIYGNDCNISYTDRIYGTSNIPRHEFKLTNTYTDISDDMYRDKCEIDRVIYSNDNNFDIEYDIDFIGIVASYINDKPSGEITTARVIRDTFGVSGNEFPLFNKKLGGGSFKINKDTDRLLRGPFKLNITDLDTSYNKINLKLDFIDPYGKTTTIIIDSPQDDIVNERLKLNGNYEDGEKFILRIHIRINKYNEYIFIPINYEYIAEDRITTVSYNSDITFINPDGILYIYNSSLNLNDILYTVHIPDIPSTIDRDIIFKDNARDSFTIDIILNESTISPYSLFLVYVYWNLLQTTVFKPNSRKIYANIHIKKYNKLLELDSEIPLSLINSLNDLPNDDTL